MPDARPLPLPGSEELTALGITGDHQLIYSFLYERRDSPPTMREIRAHVEAISGTDDEQTDRRKRDLHKTFKIAAPRWSDGKYRHQLLGWADIINASAHVITKKVRFQVLQPGRCFKCGRTAEAHGVVLVVDHVIPQKWGGGNDISNLQPLCEDCNQGKKDYYGQFDQYAGAIRAAVDMDEPLRRIASLFVAFQGDWVPTELIGAVASAKQYQEDYQRRIRDLRYFDWDIRSKQERPTRERVRVFYRAASMPPLPNGDLAQLVRRIERERAVAKRALQASSAGDVKAMAKLAARELAGRADTHPAG